MNKVDLREAGVPFLQLDRDYISSSKGQLRTRIQAFLETIGG
jgi:benzoyl-CoA reductase/2-hydroxyglutaryl-CoA dehydratase subunit BcrC/BadD/HgdB